MGYSALAGLLYMNARILTEVKLGIVARAQQPANVVDKSVSSGTGA
jgi:hypothetical protein